MMERKEVDGNVSLENLVYILEQNDSSIEEIATVMRPMKETTRECLIIVARSLHKQELVRRIEQANDLLLLQRIEDFRRAVRDDTYREFLQPFSWSQTVALLINIERFSQKYPEEEGLTEAETKQYLAILRTILLEKANEEALLQNEGSPAVLERNKV